MPNSEQICKTSACTHRSHPVRRRGADAAQIVLLGKRRAAAGAIASGHSVRRTSLDIDGIYAAITDAGFALPRDLVPRISGPAVNASSSARRIRAASCGPAPDHARRSDVHTTATARPAVVGVAAAAIGGPAVFVSVDASHQGPQAAGPSSRSSDVGE